MTEETEDLVKSLRRLVKATPAPKETYEPAVGQMIAASRRKGGRRKAQRRGK